MKHKLLMIMLFGSIFSFGQISIPSTTAVTQNFDGMVATTNLPSNWRMHASTSSPTWSGASTSVTQQASSGAPATGGTYNFGSSTSERAVGAMTSGGFASPNNLLGFFQNTNVANIESLSISYDAERYRINTAAASVQFFYSLNGTSWTAITAGDIATTSFPTGASAYNFTTGTVINKTGISITGLSIATNSPIYLRWNINTTGGNSQGIAIDNVSVVATFASSCTPPADPTGSITVSANPSCGVATLSYPAGYYWQTTATGTSTLLPTSANYSLTSTGTVYVRAYDGTSCWSTAAISSGSVTINSPINITTQPSGVSIASGSNTSFSVVASNVASYQWQVDTGSGFVDLTNGAPYSNVTTSTLNITAATFGMNTYQYRCVLTGTSPCLAVNSDSATLAVGTPLAPVISSSLTKSNVYGITDTYTITASNSPTSYSTGTLPTGFTFSGAVITKANTVDVGTYTISISATNTGGTDAKILVWIVTQKPLTITGLSGVNKIYDGFTTATLSGTAALNGIVFSDDVTLSGTPISNFADKNVGTGKTITTTGFTLSGTKAANYSVTQPTATANISAKALTISAPTIASKVYNASAVSGIVTAGTLSGLIGSETLMVTATGLYADANAGIAKPATVTYAWANGSNGGLATNYSLANGAGTGDITKANPVFTVATIPISVGGTYILPGSNVASTSDGTLSYSISGGGFATLTGSTINGVGVGSETLTINQAVSTNYEAGSTTVGVTVTNITYGYNSFLSITGTGVYTNTTSVWSKCGNVGGCTGTTIGSGGWGALGASGQVPSATGTAFIQGNITGGTTGVANVTILSGGTLTTSGNYPISGSLTVKTGGTLNVNSNLNFNSSAATFTIEKNATVVLNNAYANPTTTIWNGQEDFDPESIVKITNWDDATSLFTFTSGVPSITPKVNSGYSAFFGYLIIDTTLGNNWTVLPSTASYNITHNDFTITNNNTLASGQNTTLYSGNSNSMAIGRDFIVNTPLASSVQYQTGVGTPVFNIKRDFIKNGTGTGEFRFFGGATTKGTINIDGNIFVNEGIFNLQSTGSSSGSTYEANLKGNLTVAANGILRNGNTNASSYPNSFFNFTGTSTIQTIDIASTGTNENNYINFNVKNGSVVQLINRDFELGSNSKLTVESGGTFDFGFNGLTALNLNRVTSQTGQSFTAQSGSTLKITSPLGINSFGVYTGNVQVGATSVNRVFDVGATYHYIGKVNQVIGNGLQNAAANKYIIVELATDNLEFTSNNGIIRFNNPASAIGSNFRGFEIRKGTVIADDTGNRFEDSATTGEVGNLKMTGGIYKIFTKDVQPAVSGNYELSTGSKIIFAHTTVASTTQAIRGGTDYQYPEIEVEGKDVRYSNVNVNMKSNGLFTVKENAILTNTGNSGQIVSLNDTNPATLTIKNTGIFKTEKEKGFSGVPDGINPSPSVRTNNASGNVLVILEPGSTVEYSRSGDQVITNATVTTPSDANYQNFTISGASGIKTLQNPTNTKINEDLNVASSKLLLNVGEIITVRKGVKIASGGAEFEIKNNGQLIQLDQADTNTGIGFKYNRIAQADHDDYIYWSSPVDAFNLDNILGADRYFWNPLNANANGTVGNWNVPATATPMQKARGYIVKVPNSFPTATASPLLSLFEGKPNNGALTFDIARAAIVNSEDDRWNLTGNPYPSAIDAEQFLTANDTKINGAVWVWTHGQSPNNTVNPYYQNFAYNYYASDYVIYNKLGSSDPNTFSGKIAAGQSFMVNMLTSAATPNTISFSNAMRTDASLVPHNNADFYKTSNPNTITTVEEKHRIWIDILNTTDGQKDRILLGYATNATLGKDHFYDCFYSPKSTEVGIYTLINSDPFSIQGRSLPFTNTDIVPLGVSIINAGNHKIALSKVDGLFQAGQDIYLEDNLLHIIHDLKVSPYSFTAPIGIFNDRFVIRYTNATLTNPDFDASNNMVLVAVQINQIMVKSAIDAIASVDVYDVLGREITKLNDINQKEVTLNNVSDKKQALILKITLENGLVVTKKIIL